MKGGHPEAESLEVLGILAIHSHLYKRILNPPGRGGGGRAARWGGAGGEGGGGGLGPVECGF